MKSEIFSFGNSQTKLINNSEVSVSYEDITCYYVYG